MWHWVLSCSGFKRSCKYTETIHASHTAEGIQPSLIHVYSLNVSKVIVYIRWSHIKQTTRMHALYSHTHSAYTPHTCTKTLPPLNKHVALLLPSKHTITPRSQMLLLPFLRTLSFFSSCSFFCGTARCVTCGWGDATREGIHQDINIPDGLLWLLESNWLQLNI